MSSVGAALSARVFVVGCAPSSGLNKYAGGLLTQGLRPGLGIDIHFF